MTEEIKGLHVKDYTDLTPDALEEMAKLDEQLGEHLRRLSDFLQEEDYERLKYNLDCLITDNDSHRDYCVRCQEEVLYKMECHEASKHFEDYMNPPSGTRPQDDDGYYEAIKICQNNHKVYHNDCEKCTEPCCFMSDVNQH